MSSAVSPDALLEQMRRLKLYNPNFAQGNFGQGLAPQGQIQDQSRAPVQAPVQTPSQVQQAPSQTDQALSQYRQVLQEKAPSQASYHPSLARRAIGAVLGGAAGMTDPQGGKALAQGIVYGPYEKQLSDYQKRLAQKKEAYETESGAESSKAKIEEQKSQREAEAARAGAEKAREERERFEITPEAHQRKLEELRISHPGRIPPNELYRVPLLNGEEILAYRGVGGQFFEPGSDTPLGERTYDASKVTKIGTNIPKDPKLEDKPRNEYSDFYRGMKTKHPNMTDDEISEAYKKIAPPERLANAPIVIGSDGKVIALKPGMTAPEGFKTVAGESSENIPTAQTRQMAEFSPRVVDLADRTSKLVDEQVKSLGPAAGRWNELWTGRIGAANSEFAKLRTNVALLASALVRMHTGARGAEKLVERFMDLIDSGKQSPENLKAALEEIKSYANDVSKSVKKGTLTESKSNEPTLDEIDKEVQRMKKLPVSAPNK
jgi:hypothetical protein